jgi:two-component system nitrate/nitrite response regulator NarL
MTAQTLKFGNDRSTQAGHSTSTLASAIRTALISDSPLLLSGLQHILQGTPFVLAEAASASDPAQLQHFALEPALVIIEANRSTSRALQVVKQVREQFPAVRVVALADQFDLSFVRIGHDAGVNGFCLAASAPDVLIKSLELVILGESVLPLRVLSTIMDGASRNQQQPLHDNTAEPNLPNLTTCKLSARETEILSCLRDGAPNKVIARKLDITEATIKVHVKAILRKIGVTNRTQAAIWASQRLPRCGGASVNV